MHRIGLGLVVLVTLLGILPAAAADGDVLRRFGMHGRLAVDCAAPASSTNPHLVYAVSPQGQVTRTLRMDPSLDGTFPMRNLRLLAPDRLQYEETGRRAEFVITVARIGGRYRSWQSVQGDGKVLIQDGKFPESGAPTLAFEVCRN